MTARHRSRRGRRGLAKPLVGAFLALAGTLAPIDAPGLPEPLASLVGPSRASAQTDTGSVTEGTPDDCPDDPGNDEDQNDPSLCILTRPACAESPLQDEVEEADTEFLEPSAEFPDFCAMTVLESESVEDFRRCTSLRGFVVEEFETDEGRACRIIGPAACASGMHRVRHDECREVRRRTWSCDSGIPRNEFNTCYVAPDDYSGSHPACDGANPVLVVLSCEEYVGQDFLRDTDAPCTISYVTGRLGDHSNRHWCTYDASRLMVDCHNTATACPASTSLCIRRASATGGCDMIANTIRCRGLQADFLDPFGDVTADDVYTQGCTPCIVLPFESLPSECPGASAPSTTTNSHFEAAFRVREDFHSGSSRCGGVLIGGSLDDDCRGAPTCADPPSGHLTWAPSHSSLAAVVNSTIILDVVDIPTSTQTVELYSRRPLFWRRSIQYFEYSEADDGDPVVRMWPQVDPTRTYRAVDALFNSGECRIDRAPAFRIVVEELWPDDDQELIEDLFGDGSLAWWNDLSDQERRDRTRARGSRAVGRSVRSRAS